MRFIQALTLITSLIIPLASPAADRVAVIPLWTTKDLKNVVTVSQKNGDFTDPAAALNSISNASASNPYLLMIGPGVYTLSQPLEMKEYVTIAGAGEQATILTGGIGSAGNDAASCLIAGADNAALQWLTVQNTGGAAYACGIYNNNASPVIGNVIVEVSGGSSRNTGILNTNATPVIKDASVNLSGGNDNFAIFNNPDGNPEMLNVSLTSANGAYNNWGVYSSFSNPILRNITVRCSGGVYAVGIYNYYSTSSPENLDASCTGASTGNYGMYSYSSTYQIRRSILNGNAPGAGLYTSGGTVYVSQSTIMGGVMGSAKYCVASDNGAGTALVWNGCN